MCQEVRLGSVGYNSLISPFYIPFTSRWNNLLIRSSPLIHPNTPRDPRGPSKVSRFFRYRGTETHTARTKRFSPWWNFSVSRRVDPMHRSRKDPKPKRWVYWLVVEPTQFDKIWDESKWESSPKRCENKKYFKPPPRFELRMLWRFFEGKKIP